MGGDVTLGPYNGAGKGGPGNIRKNKIQSTLGKKKMGGDLTLGPYNGAG